MDGFNDRFNQTEINEGKVPIELQDLGTEVCSILYYVSFGCCFLVFLGYAFIRYFDPLHDRLTVRLIVYSAIAHIVLGTAGVIRINRVGSGRPNACKTIMFFYIFANLFSTMTITCIAVNLQVVFVHGVKRKRYLERVYLSCSFLVAFILAAVPLFPSVDSYKNNPRMHDCWFKQSKSGTTGIWGVMGLYFWLILSTAYCLIALILVLGKMWREEFIINRHLRVQTINHHSNNEASRWFYRFPWSLFFRPSRSNPIAGVVRQQQRDEESVIENTVIMNNNYGGQQSQHRYWSSNNVRHPLHTIRMIRSRQLQVSYVAKVASRVIWFPIILILSRIWGVIDSLITFEDRHINPFTMLMAYVSVPMQGIFLFFVFLFDPSFHHAIHTVLGRKDERQQQQQQQQQQKQKQKQKQKHKGVDSILGSTTFFHSTSSSPSPLTSPELSPSISQKRRGPKLRATQSEKTIYTSSPTVSPLCISSVDERCFGGSISVKDKSITMSAPSSPRMWQYQQPQQHDQGSLNFYHRPFYSKFSNTSSNNKLSFPTTNNGIDGFNNNVSPITDTAILLSPEKIMYPNNNTRRNRRNRYRLYHSDSCINESSFGIIQQEVLNKNNDNDSEYENEVLRQM